MATAVVHADAERFLARASPWLMEREAENNLILGIAAEHAGRESRTGYESPFWATVEDDGRVVGCAFRTPPHKLGITRLPMEAAPALVRAVASRFDRLPAVLGPPEAAEAVAVAWGALVGATPRVGMRQRIYRLDEVDAPEGVPGRLRLAGPADLDLIAEWGDGFARDAGVQFRTAPETQAAWVAQQCIYLWEDGRPVSMATGRGGTPNGVRVGYVYTPEPLRRRGYASALVASTSQRLLDEGYTFCVLYTDLSNPTSNAIYQRIGYRPVCDVIDVHFG